MTTYLIVFGVFHYWGGGLQIAYDIILFCPLHSCENCLRNIVGIQGGGDVDIFVRGGTDGGEHFTRLGISLVAVALNDRQEIRLGGAATG